MTHRVLTVGWLASDQDVSLALWLCFTLLLLCCGTVMCCSVAFMLLFKAVLHAAVIAVVILLIGQHSVPAKC